MNNKRSCRKCGELIPNRMTIEGKTKILSSRKFCLTCSPYKKHNTKSDDPSKPAKRESCYSKWSDDEKKKNMLSVLGRGLKRKQKLIEMSGNKCLLRDYIYNGCERALSFHHRFQKKRISV